MGGCVPEGCDPACLDMCAQVRLLGRYSSHLWERWIGSSLYGYLVHVCSSVAVAFCTFSKALRPMVGARVLRRFVGRDHNCLCFLLVVGYSISRTLFFFGRKIAT